LGVMALAALSGFFHYTRVGPNEVSEEEERDAQDEARRAKERSDET
jgi:formate dehydrogenase iron-sulfur subunit